MTWLVQRADEVAYLTLGVRTCEFERLVPFDQALNPRSSMSVLERRNAVSNEIDN